MYQPPYRDDPQRTKRAGVYPPVSPDFEPDPGEQPLQEDWSTYQDNGETYPMEGQDNYQDGEWYDQGYDPNQGYEPNPDYPEDMEEAVLPEKTYRRTIFKPKVRKSSFILSVLVNAVRIFVLLGILGGLAGLGAVLGIAKAYVETAPTLDLALLDAQDQTSFIYDADGNLITDYKGTENRVMVSIDQMPTHLQNAFIAVEDARFFTHNGVDVKRIVGSFITNLTTGSNQGGSTITQQLIKQTVLSDELSYKRKIQEAYLAMQLETRYSKQQILESYLNTVYLGENYYGVQVAAQGYFGKNLGELTLRECAMLAGVNNAPYYYNPRRNFYMRSAEGVDYPAITNNRTNYVLRCMYENQFITQQQYTEALNVDTAAVLKTSPSEGAGMYKYAHYVEYAVRDVVDKFLQLEGLPDTSANRYAMENKLRTGGYHVKLAIDTQIQEIVEDTLENWKNYPSLRNPSDKIYRARNADGTYSEIIQPQAAAVVLDYRTGELKAIVGGRTRPTQRKTLNRATDNQMPVGSAIKPLAVYAPAIDSGASPATVVYNMPLPIAGWKNEKNQDYWPENYGGGGYKGPQTLREAMKRSYNVSAAQIMMTIVGVDKAVDYLQKMGVDREHIDATPFGVSLGSSGISPLEMTAAYGTLANGGMYQEPISFLGISDSNGNVIYDSHARQQRRQVFKPSTAWLVVDMMKDVVSGGTGTGAKISGQTVAGKTGTNSDQKGIGFAGMTGWYVSYVWIGHDNYKALSSKTTGSNTAAPLWKAYMSKIHTAKNLQNRDIMEGDPADYGLVKVTTCGVSGQLATTACKNDQMGYGSVTDYWAVGTKPLTECQMHKTMTVCTESGKLATDYCPTVVRANKGVIVIPKGHPLYKFIDSKYTSTLQKYLGDFATLRYTNDANANAALNGMINCDIHGPGTDNNNYIVTNTMIPDANRLIGQAQTLLGGLQQGTDAYNNLQNAISNLQNLVSQSNPSTASMAQAMSYLTQMMAAAQ